MIIINNDNGFDNNINCCNGLRNNTVSYLDLLSTHKKRKIYVHLCFMLGVFGVHKFYIRRTLQGFLFLIFGVGCLFPGLLLFIPNFWSVLVGETINDTKLFAGTVLIAISVLTLIICIADAVKWMFFHDDNDFARIVNKYKVPLKNN